MLVETNNLVSAKDFCEDIDTYIAAAERGNGPVAILRDSRVVGVFISPDDYEALNGGEIAKLLKSRERGPSVSQDAVRKMTDKAIQRRRKA